MELIEHLREIERRMLFAELGYASLWELCVKHLGLSEGSAHRRIAAMRLVRDVPEVKESLATGKLSLSNAASLQGFFRNEKKVGKARASVAKAELAKDLEGLTQRECERKLCEANPNAIPQERQRAIGPNQVELRIVLDTATLEKLERLKGLLAHQLPGASAADLITTLLEDKLAELEKEKSGSGTTPREPQTPRTSRNTRYIPAQIRREVWKRAQGQCEFQVRDQTHADSPPQRRCTSRHALEIDHIMPVAQGGTSELRNLRLLCKIHNQQQALAKLGAAQMSPHLPGLRH